MTRVCATAIIVGACLVLVAPSVVAQSDSQIGKLYSKEDQQIIYATTAVKYILPQNDKDTIKLVQEMA